ncbi:hypothetical protein SAMN05216330_1303 [Bradyrhizobium sp. Ghvi]|uniref:hypothetical protein n=1 Tax=Bradyrhizobium sp. Ghvi TaxID=1855319 RepID=UPI0008E6BACD|nr:hypothetical protein [Bradyrhizobium sp. Ghvi]SFQ34782.1 hypothetical protein SAMN05216330_1303 [Bradyrhizobium sp. Ghvi]
MAGSPLDLVSSKTVYARRARLWCKPVRLDRLQFNPAYLDGALAVFEFDEKAANGQALRFHQALIGAKHQLVPALVLRFIIECGFQTPLQGRAMITTNSLKRG